MAKMNLFTLKGEVVKQIEVPSPEPGIVVYMGLYFHLVNGRYVQATVYEHIGD